MTPLIHISNLAKSSRNASRFNTKNCYVQLNKCNNKLNEQHTLRQHNHFFDIIQDLQLQHMWL